MQQCNRKMRNEKKKKKIPKIWKEDKTFISVKRWNRT